MTGNDHLKARLLRLLRASRLPVATGDLARRCAGDMPHPVQQTGAALKRLLRCGVVRRRPVARGEGRPAWRWELRSTG